MKKLYTLFLLACCIGGLAGCSDDEETLVSVLKVVKADVSYTAEGGSGVIEVASTETLTATSSEEWCGVSVEGNRVKLTVANHVGEASRSAVIVIRTATADTQVPVYQQGYIMDTDMEDTQVYYGGGEYTFRIKAMNYPLEVSASADWVTYRMEGENLVVTVAAMPDGMPTGRRSATVTVASGPVQKQTMTFTQENMAGEFNCFHTVDGEQQPYGTCRLEVTDNPTVYRVVPQGSKFDGPYLLTFTNNTFIIHFNQVLGRTRHEDGTDRNVVLCAFDTKGTLAWGAGIQYVAPLAFDGETHAMTLAFQDNGTWEGQHVDGFYYSIADVNGTPTGTGWSAVNLVLVRK